MICPAKTSTSVLTGASVIGHSHCGWFVLWVGSIRFCAEASITSRNSSEAARLQHAHIYKALVYINPNNEIVFHCKLNSFDLFTFGQT